MNDLFGSSRMADWILLTAIHSLWLSPAALLLVHIRKLRAPAVRSVLCTFTLFMLLALPLITWFAPRAAVRPQSIQKASAPATVPIAESTVPLIKNWPDIKTPFSQTQVNQGKVLMNQFGLLWLAVTLSFLGRLFFQLAFLKGYCTGLQEVTDDRISAVSDEITGSFGFRKKPRFYISPSLTSPVSMGMRTPLVIFPADLYGSIGETELRVILLHELAHIYHYDHVLGLLQRILKALYWWNPFVYRLCNTLSVAREEVSDNYAISGMKSAASYAALLVGLIEKTSLISRMPCTAGMATPYESMETRIKNIVSKERDMRVKTNRWMRFLVVLSAVLICGLVVIGSQIKVFGIAQKSFSEDAKRVVVNISSTEADFNMDLLQGSVLVLEAPDTTRYQSSPILIDGNQGNCEFSELIPPGPYKLAVNIFNLQTDVMIPQWFPDPAVTLEMKIAPGGISIGMPVMLRNDRAERMPLILRNKDADTPLTTPLRLDESYSPGILSMVEPQYPTEAKSAGIVGYSIVQVVVNEEGEVYEAKILSGHPFFRQPALNAAVQWKFQPLIINGDAKPFVTTVTLEFGY